MTEVEWISDADKNGLVLDKKEENVRGKVDTLCRKELIYIRITWESVQLGRRGPVPSPKTWVYPVSERGTLHLELILIVSLTFNQP